MTISVLIAADEALVARDLQLTLECAGFTVSAVVATGKEAVELATARRPDLVLMDIVLAGAMSGIEAAAEIRRTLDIPVVYLTAYTDEATLAGAGVTDPAAYVVKPFHERELRAVLEIALYRAQINEERKQAAAALQESEQRFRQLAESTPQAFWMFDCATRQVIYCSPAYEKIWKRPVATLLSRYEEWTDSLHPADRDAVLAWRARIAEPGGAEECEYRILRPDGIVRWISDRAFAIRDAQGRVSRIAGVAEDITARKLAEEQLRASRTELEERIETSAAELKAVNERLQAEIEEHRQTVAALRASEERYRMLFEAAADVIFTASPDGLITSLNPAFEKITGWPRSRFIGASYRSLIHPEDLPRSDELLRRAAAGEQTPIHTLRIVSQSGQILVGEFNETVLVQDGKVVGLLGIARNITHRDPTPAVAP